MAPEILNVQLYDGKKVDTFAAGIVLFEMVSCRHPWNGEIANIQLGLFKKFVNNNE